MLLTDARLTELCSLPISLPLTELGPGSWIIVSSVELEAPAQLTLKNLQLHVSDMSASDSTDTCGTSSKNDINPDFLSGSLATALVIATVAPDSLPYLQPYAKALAAPEDFNSAPNSRPPIVSVLGESFVTLTAAVYSVVVLNNSTNRTLAVSLTGSWVLDQNPA